jgi:hypothetical protein
MKLKGLEVPWERIRMDKVIRRPNLLKVKKCGECEHVNDKGYCSFFMLHAYLRNGCRHDRDILAEKIQVVLDREHRRISGKENKK